MQVDLSLEMRHLELGHKCRKKRFAHIINTLVSNPSSSIPRASYKWADIKGAYRFFSNQNIKVAAISEAISKATVERCQSHEVVLSVQDTTNICFSSSAEGLGYMDHGRGNGFMVHNIMAIDTQGCALGLLHQQIWARDKADMGKGEMRASKAIEQKESHKWIEGIETSERILKDKHIIHIADREADIYEVFSKPRQANSELLIRARHDRKTLLGDSMWKEIEAEKPIAYFDIDIENAVSGKTVTTAMHVKTGMVVVAPPNKKPHLPALMLYGIIVTEVNPGTAKPLEWRLISSMPVKDRDHALQLVRYYTYRWRIERFHYILKSGCKLQELQFRNADALHRATVVYSLCAFKLMQILYHSRIAPDQPCSIYFEEKEWHIMAMIHYKRKNINKQPLPLQLAIAILAKLGGYIGRNNDGPPGIKTMWQGLQKLHAMMLPFDILPLDISTF